MKVKMILPALQEAESPYWRPIKYSLFPPLGLATLAAYFGDDDDVEIVDQHVEKLTLDDEPDLVCIQVYVTNAYRAYRIADHYRQKGTYVAMGGLHVTSLPDEAAQHADTKAETRALKAEKAQRAAEEAAKQAKAAEAPEKKPGLFARFKKKDAAEAGAADVKSAGAGKETPKDAAK